MMTAVALLSMAAWAYLLFGRGWFWLGRERDDSVAIGERRGVGDRAQVLARRRGDHPGSRRGRCDRR